MHYVISDIHGHAAAFRALLRAINLTDTDTLYVLGDAIDRGDDPIGVLREMSLRPNIIPIVGNHEYMLLKVLPDLLTEMREDNVEQVLTMDFLQAYQSWLQNGGGVTIKAFRALDEAQRGFYLDYIADFSLYEEVVIDGRRHVLIHSLPSDFLENAAPERSIEEIVFGRPDFSGDWSQECVYIIGHTPTFLIAGQAAGKVFKNGSLINVDCGCGAGCALAVYCVETGEAVYAAADGTLL